MLKRIIASAVLAFLTNLANGDSSQSPNLLYESQDGEIFPVSGQQYVVGKARPYYFDHNNEKTYITSLDRVYIKTTANLIAPYAILPDFYTIKRQTSNSRTTTGSSLSLLKASFTNGLLEAWPQRTSPSDVFSIVWIRDQTVTPIYLSREIRTLSFASLPDAATNAQGPSYQGYPALLVFRDGKAMLPTNTEVTTLRFENNQDLNSKLESAALNGFTNYLQEHIPPKNKQNAKLYNRILQYALFNGRTDAANLILDEFAKTPNKRQRKVSEYEIHGTLVSGHLQTLVALLSHTGIQIASRSNEIVEQAVNQGHFDIADSLLKIGYKLDVPPERRPVALKDCLYYNRVDYIEKLYPNHKPSKADFHLPFTTSIYHEIAAQATPETLHYISQFDIPVDLEDPEKYTPLIKAAGYGNIPAVCWFLDNGARIDHRNEAGHTALQYSIVKQQAEATACLLQQGSDINLLGPEGVTPLMQAALFRDLASAQSIAQAGGIWNLQAHYLDHCLSYTLQQDLAPILQIAIEQGLSPQYKVYGKWPMDWLASFYQSPACQTLLDPHNRIQITHTPLPSSDLHLEKYDRREYKAVASSPDLPESLTFNCLVNNGGHPTLVTLLTPVERFLENDIRKLLSTFSFASPLLADDQHYILNATLNLTNPNTSLADTLSINKLSQIQAPTQN